MNLSELNEFCCDKGQVMLLESEWDHNNNLQVNDRNPLSKDKDDRTIPYITHESNKQY